jgi:hypothetical protein
MTTARPKGPSRQRSYRTSFDFASVSADTTQKFDGIKRRSVRVDRVWLSCPTGVTANGSNFVNFKVIKGASTVMANWTTATGVTGQGTITASTPIELVLTSTVADRYLADGDVLSLFIDVTGTITVPLGRIVVEGTEL